MSGSDLDGRPGPSQARPAPTRERTSILGALSWFGVSYGFAILGGLGVNAIASRWLGVEQFGYFIVATTVSTGLGQLALLGVHRAGLRDAATMEVGADHDTVLRNLRSAARGAIGVSLPLFSLLAAGALYLVVDADAGGDRFLLAGAFGGLVFLNGLQKLWASYLRGMGSLRLAGLLEGRSGGALVAVSQAAILALAWVVLAPSGLTGALLAVSVGYLLPVLALGAVVQRRWRHLGPGDGAFVALFRAVRRTWKFAVNQFAAYLSSTVEIWMAGLLLTALDTSLFSSAQRLSLLIVTPLIALQVVFAPLCARLLHQGRTQDLERVLRTGATVAAVGTAFLWLPILVAPGMSLTLVFGAQFSAAAAVLVVLSLGNVVNVLTGLSAVALTMSHREGVAARIQVVALVARLVTGTVAALTWGSGASPSARPRSRHSATPSCGGAPAVWWGSALT